MKKTAIVLMILTIFTKTLGFAREIILSYFYGASYISDVYLVALTIPGTIFAFIGTGIITGYIPMYSSIEKDSDVKSADRFTSNIINFILIICTLIVFIVLVSTENIVKLFASGFNGKVFELAVDFTRISTLGIFFTAITYVFSGYLNLKNTFLIPALMSLPFNFFIIISIILSYRVDMNLLPFGSVVAVAFQLLFLIPFVYKKGFRYKLVLDKKDKYLKQMVILSLPVIIGVSVNQINILVDKTIASQIVLGGISALNYASRLNGFVQGIFISSIATVLYPMISKMVAEENLIGLKNSIVEAINGINLLVLPATLGAMVFAQPIVTLLFGRGAFDAQAIILTSSALFFYSIGMIGFGLREILSRVFYSMQDTKTPMINAAIGMFLNIILNIVLSKYMGISGLALATSIAAIFTTGLMFISLRKKIGPFGIKQISISFVKILFASLLMGIFAKLTFNALAFIISQNLSLLISIVIGALTYFIIIYFMKIDDVDVIVNAVKKKLSKGTK